MHPILTQPLPIRYHNVKEYILSRCLFGRCVTSQAKPEANYGKSGQWGLWFQVWGGVRDRLVRVLRCGGCTGAMVHGPVHGWQVQLGRKVLFPRVSKMHVY